MTDNFASKAAEWDNPGKVAMTQKFVDELFLNIDFNKEWKALELGAGTGLVGMEILPEIGSLVFEDTSEAMLGVLKSKLNGDENAAIVHGEIFEYQKQDIDLVFSLMAFHHIPDMPKALKHLFSITKPGALVVVGDLTSEDGSFHSFEPIPHKGFDMKELAGWFEAAGFSVKNTYIYNTMARERIPGTVVDYDQFFLLAEHP